MRRRDQTWDTWPSAEVALWRSSVTELSRSRFLGVLALNLLFIWVIAEIGGWAGFVLLFVGVLILGACAFKRGADSRDGRNWTNGRGIASGTKEAIDHDFVDDQIDLAARTSVPPREMTRLLVQGRRYLVVQACGFLGRIRDANGTELPERLQRTKKMQSRPRAPLSVERDPLAFENIDRSFRC